MSGGRWLATTPEQPTQETAAALGALGQLALQILDLGLEILQALLLHQDHLGQEIGGGGLAGHEAVDQGLGLAIAFAHLGLRLLQALEETLDHAFFLFVHGYSLPGLGDEVLNPFSAAVAELVQGQGRLAVALA